MLTLVGSVFIASLLGSTHCAGMCGAFLAFAVAGPGDAAPSAGAWRLHSAYNLGRLLTYTALGAVAGGVGSLLEVGGAIVGVQRAAAIGAGGFMMVFAIIALLRLAGVRVPGVRTPAALQRLAIAGHRRAHAWSPVMRAGATGLLTTLLPCGWLYAFVVTSAGTASAPLGALTMGVFWLGTLPVMVMLGVGVRSLAGPLRARLPVLTNVLVLVVGLMSVLGRVEAPASPVVHSAGLREHLGPASSVQQLEALTRMQGGTCHGD